MNDELFNRTNQRTVPNIFVKGKHIGGCDKTVALLASGELQRILADESTPYPVPKEAPDRLIK
jgi:glutaredoxin-related protein